jgi:hypothetical protein
MKMKCSRSFIITVGTLIIAALFLRSRIDGINDSLMTTGQVGAREYLLEQERLERAAARLATNNPAPQPSSTSSNRPPHDLGI